jgi:phage-related minor tail protein
VTTPVGAIKVDLVIDGSKADDQVTAAVSKAVKPAIAEVEKLGTAFGKVGKDGYAGFGWIGNQLREVERASSDLSTSLNKAIDLKPAMTRAEGVVDRSVANMRASIKGIDSGASGIEVASKLKPELERAERAVDSSVSSMSDKLSNISVGISAAFGGIAETIGSAGAGAAAAGAAAGAGFVQGFGGPIAALGTKAGPIGVALAATAGVGLLAGKVLADSILDGMGQLQEQANVAAQLGLSPEQMRPLGAAASEAYADGFGESVAANLDAVRASVQAGILDPDANAADVEKVVAQLNTVAQVTGEEIPAAVRTAQQAVRTGLAKDYTEAFDLIVAAQQRGLNVSGDLFDTINEYGTQFRKIGLDGADAFGLIQQAVQGGARDTDIAADAIKEFSIRAIDGSKLTTAAYENLGLSTKATTDAFAAGGQTARDMFQQVIDRIGAVTDPAQKAAIQVALFGTQSEDLGNALNNLDLSTAADQFGEVAGAAQQAADTVGNAAAARWESAKRSIEVAADSVRMSLAEVAGPALQRLSDWIINNREQITDFFIGLARVSIDAGAFAVRGIGEIIKAVGQLGAGLGNVQGAVLKFQAWQAEFRGDNETAAELRRQSEAAFSFGEGLTAVGDSMANFDATPLYRALDEATEKARGATGETSALGDELGALPVDGVDVPITVDTSAADTAMTDFFTKYRELSVGVEIGDPAAAAVLGGGALGAGIDPSGLGIRGDVAGLNLSTVEVSAQEFANNCISAAARIILSATDVVMSEVDIDQVIARGGSIDSLAAGLNQLNPEGKYVAMAGSGGSPDALYAAVKDSIDKGIGSVLNVAPGSSIGGTTFDYGHFIAITGYDPTTGQINLSDTADGSVYSVSAAEAFQASRGRGIVAGTGTGGNAPAPLGIGNTAGFPLDLSKLPPAPTPTPPVATPATPTTAVPTAPIPTVTVPQQNVSVVPLTTPSTGDPVTDALQAQLDNLNNQARAADASKAATEAAQAVADAKADAEAKRIARDAALTSTELKTNEEKAKAEQEYQDSLKAVTDAQNAEAELLNDRQRGDLQDQITARRNQQTAATAKPFDYSKLPMGNPQRAAAAALSSLGATPEDISGILGGQALGAAQSAAGVVGPLAGDALAAAMSVPLPGPLGYQSTPTAPDTELQKLVQERNPAALAAAAGLAVPDYTRQGGGPGATDVMAGATAPDAQGRIYSDTAALIDRTFTNADAADKARHDQTMAVLNEVKARLGGEVLGPVLTEGVTSGVQGLNGQDWTAVGQAIGNAAGPIIADQVASAVASKTAASGGGGGGGGAGGILGGLLPGFASGGGVTGGTPGKDSVPAMLMPGEFVLTSSEVARMGGFAGMESFRAALNQNNGMRFYATGGGVGQDANATVGADFFGVSEVPILGAVVNLLVRVLLRILDVQIEQRDMMTNVSDEFRGFRAEFTAFDAVGRIYNDTSGLTDRTGTSEQAAADERIRILKIVIDALVKYIIEKVIVPIAKAVGNALVQAGAGAASAAINTQAPGAGGIVGTLISSAGSAGIDIGAEIASEVSQAVISLAVAGIAEGLQSYFPGITTSVFGGGIAAGFADPVSMGLGTVLGGLVSVLALLTDPLSELFGGNLSFDSGGLARGVGMMPKATLQPERVLSPSQTRSFDRLVDALTSGKTVAGQSSTVIHAPFNVTGDERGARIVHDRLLALTS